MPKAKKTRSILHGKDPTRDKRAQVKAKAPQHKKGTPKSSQPKRQQCANIIDKQAAFAVEKLVLADATQKQGASLKSLTLAPHIEHKKATYAVTCQVLKYLPVLRQLLDSVEIIGVPKQGLSRKGPAEKAVLAQKAELKQCLQKLLQQGGAQTMEELLPGSSKFEGTPHPRTARVNTLKSSVDQVLQQLQQPPKVWKQKHWQQQGKRLADVVEVDPLLPDMLAFPHGTDLHDHPLVLNGTLILQGKASCMPAHALNPQPSWTVVDCCAAPGNKTTHVAARLGSQGGGRVLAFDKNAKRLKRLVENAQRAGAADIITACQADFLSLDPEAPEFREVKGVILDPSCSGSGTLYTRMDHLLPSQSSREQSNELQQEDPSTSERVQQLAKFQQSALRHALRFPTLERLVYSTCSVHSQENEMVVQAVLEEAAAQGFHLADPFPTWHRRGLPLFPGCEKLVRTDPFEDGTDGFFIAVFQQLHTSPCPNQPDADQQITLTSASKPMAKTIGRKHKQKVAA